MSNTKKLTVLIAVVIALSFAFAATTSITSILLKQQSAFAFANIEINFRKAPIATSGDKNVYVAWPSNKTGNDEVMFKASMDGGKTFEDKINLSNSSTSESQDVQIAASGNNVYVSWWERNQTSNEPVLRVSNDNGKSFGPMIMLSTK
jgi:hypothetical protein